MRLPDPDPITADRRRTRRRDLIPAEAACALCGITDPDMLQDQHVLGPDAADSVRVWLCRNHHASQTAAQIDAQALPKPGRYRTTDTTLLHRVDRVLRGLAVFLLALAEALIRYGDQIRALITGLDAFTPAWRTQGWAL